MTDDAKEAEVVEGRKMGENNNSGQLTNTPGAHLKSINSNPNCETATTSTRRDDDDVVIIDVDDELPPPAETSSLTLAVDSTNANDGNNSGDTVIGAIHEEGDIGGTTSSVQILIEPKDSDSTAAAPAEHVDHIGGAVCIFYTESPFSDFAHAPFVIDGKYYYSVEHFFQIQMLYSFGMFRLASKLILIEDAAKFRKSLRQNLKAMIKSELFTEKMFISWRQKNALKMVKKANKAKFQQNFALKDQLLATGERILIFTNKNDFLLGVGMTEMRFLAWIKEKNIRLEDLLDFFSGSKISPKELGANYLGISLMEIRADILSSTTILADWKFHRGSITTNDDVGMEPLREIGNDSNEFHEDGVVGQDQGQENSTETSSFENGESGTKAAEASSDITVEQDTSSARPKVMILQNERRIVYQKEGAVPKIVGDIEDLRQRQEKIANSKSASFLNASQTEIPLQQVQRNSFARNSSVLDRLKSLVIERPMINPFSFGQQLKEKPLTSTQIISTYCSHQQQEIPTSVPQQGQGYGAEGSAAENVELTFHEQMNLQREESQESAQNEFKLSEAFQKMRWEREARQRASKALKNNKRIFRNLGETYHIEKGELPPEGVIMPPPDLPNATPRIGYNFCPEFAPREARPRPAALPNHLLYHLPRPPPPPGWDPSQPYFPANSSYARAPPIPLAIAIEDSPFAPYRPGFSRRRPQLQAPIHDDVSEKQESWKMPENPLRDVLKKVKSMGKEVQNRRAQLNEESQVKQYARSDEGANPLNRRKRVAEPEPISQEIIENPVAFDPVAFPFGMEATLADLKTMGFVAPPIATITGDPRAQARNKKRKANDWKTFFETPEAAFRHQANRWKKGGRLGVTGEYEECGSSDEEETDFLTNYVQSDSSDDETIDDVTGKKRPRKKFETQVIFVDTAQYEEYVRWYQHTHGFVPLPNEMTDLNCDYLRQWYQYYRTAVHPADTMDPSALDSGMGPEELYTDSDFWHLSLWKWEKEMGVSEQEKASRVVQESWTDGVSYGGKAVAYQKSSATDNPEIDSTNPTDNPEIDSTNEQTETTKAPETEPQAPISSEPQEDPVSVA